MSSTLLHSISRKNVARGETARRAEAKTPEPVATAPTLRQALERAVGAAGMRCHRSPWMTLGAVMLVVGLLASQLPKTHFLSDVDRYLAPSDPARLRYDQFRESFGRDDILLFAITPPEVFDRSFLETLREIHYRLEEELPHVAEVQSLVNARQTRGEDDLLIVDELLESWPETDEEIALVERIARSNPLYRDLYLSNDGRTAGIVIRPEAFSATEVDTLAGFDGDESAGADQAETTFLNDAQLAELVVAARGFVDEYAKEGLEIAVSGSPVINYELQQQTGAEMMRFSLLSYGVIALVLWIVFRRFVAVALPMALVAMALASTMGAIAAVGRPLTFVSQIVPSFVLAVGVGFAVHLLAIFFQRVDQGVDPERAVEGALRHSGPAILMSSLTTVGGMLSFVPTGLLPIRDIGIFVPFGVLMAAILSLTALPAALAIVRVRRREVATGGAAPAIERALVACGRFATRRPMLVTVSALCLLTVATAGIPRITEEYDPMEWLPEDNFARVGTAVIDHRLGGASGAELLLDSGRENGLLDPEMLRRIEDIQRYAEGARNDGVEISKTISIADVTKEIHQALHGGDPTHHAISDDPRLIAQELLLFESAGSDDLEDVVDSQFRYARITLKAPQVGAGVQTRFLDEHLGPMQSLAGDADLEVTGFFSLASQVGVLMSDTAIRSYAIAFALITPLMIFFIGSLRTGIVSMAPNLMPILIVLGVMGWSGAPLDIISVLIGGIALGLVVDDTIHMLHGFRREYERSGDVEQAIDQTMRTTGRAILFTTVVLAASFAIYGLAEAETVANFGRLTALAVTLAFLFDLFLAPALLALVYGTRATATSRGATVEPGSAPGLSWPRPPRFAPGAGLVTRGVASPAMAG